MINSLMIDEKDNVAVAIEPIKKGSEVNCKIGNEVISFIAKQDIQIYHKIASKDIKKGETIVKYGQHIGLAGTDIEVGEHVHIHNVQDHRENL